MGLFNFLFNFFKKPCCKASDPKLDKMKESSEKEIGVITHYFGDISVGIVKLKDTLKIGDKIHIKGVHDDFKQVVESMQFEHEDIKSASKGKEVGIKVKDKVHINDKVYKIS